METQHIWMIVVFTLLLQSSCASRTQRFSRATLNTTPGWSVEEKCGRSDCYPSSDYLISNNATIRIDTLNYVPEYIRRDVFLLRIMFPEGDAQSIEFNPSNSSVEFTDQRFLRAKGISCSAVPSINRSSLLSIPAVSDYQRITRDKYCFFLFFESSPPSVDEIFILSLNGVRQRGKLLNVPKIIFRPGKG